MNFNDKEKYREARQRRNLIINLKRQSQGKHQGLENNLISSARVPLSEQTNTSDVACPTISERCTKGYGTQVTRSASIKRDKRRNCESENASTLTADTAFSNPQGCSNSANVMSYAATSLPFDELHNSSSPLYGKFVQLGPLNGRFQLAQNLSKRFNSMTSNASLSHNKRRCNLSAGKSLADLRDSNVHIGAKSMAKGNNGMRSGKHVISKHHLLESQEETLTDPLDSDDDIEDINDHEFRLSSSYFDIGDPEFVCTNCGALLWSDERLKRFYDKLTPHFSLCCSMGKVKIPELDGPPPYLKALMVDDSPTARKFRENLRTYNAMFSFTSMGGKIDRSLNCGGAPSIFRMNGQNHHLIGSLVPPDGAKPKFAQLYVYDTNNEVDNRMKAIKCSEENEVIDAQIVQNLKEMFDIYNPLVQKFRMARDHLEGEHRTELKLRLIRNKGKESRVYNLASSSEVAMLIVGDVDALNEERDIIIETKSGLLQRIDELHPLYLPLQYPILFSTGKDGYSNQIDHIAIPGVARKTERTVSLREYFAYILQFRSHQSSILLLSRRLLQQFIVDAYTMIEAQRLSFIRYNQKKLRVDLYCGLEDALLRGEREGFSCGKRVILPSTFTGGPRYMMQNYQDAMAICNWAGFPDLFITFTCNPTWPEITRLTQKLGLSPNDCPQVLSRVFNIKLTHLMKDLKEGMFFGKYKAVVRTVEFQKRGLPHVHILVFLKPENKILSPIDVNRIVCAEIPDQQKAPELYSAVMNFMMHGPCGYANPRSPCMKDKRCTKFFPKKFASFTSVDEEGYAIYRRRDNGRSIIKNGVTLDNRYVVPYNPQLLMKYQAHINIESCNQSRSIKYLFKYINKGHDRATAAIYQTGNNANNNQKVDEIATYLDCRYISACEAAWRIYGFDIHYRWPPVERLHFHLPNEQYVYYEDGADINVVMRKASVAQSMFLAWMEANKIYPEARSLTYAEFPSKFVYNVQDRKWYPRKRGFAIGRLHYVPPCSGERYYLRMLLTKVRGPTSFEDILTVSGVVHKTFREACYALGLLDDDNEFISAIKEASTWGSGNCLRQLFVRMLLSGSVSRPEYVWSSTWKFLSEDMQFFLRQTMSNEDLILTEEDKKLHALQEIEKLLRINGRSLRDFPPMPLPPHVESDENHNRLVAEELKYDRAELQSEFKKLARMMNEEQKHVFDTIIKSVKGKTGALFFVYGYGGTGKTFLWKTLTCALRSEGQIVLTVASSGIASLLLPGGRTAHSRFRIPLNITEDSTCNINQGSELAGLLRKSKLIIWDEAPMVHKLCFEALDRSLRDLMQLDNPNSSELPFGGKSVVFGGDFRQILPVISGGHRSDIVHATINSSYLWKHCKVLTLTKNMRLQSNQPASITNEMENFAEWILQVGDGKLAEPNDGEAEIEIPSDLLLTEFEDPFQAIVTSTYPSLHEKYKDPQFLKDRAILAPTLDTVQKLNEHIMLQIPGEEKTYFSSDSVCKASFNTDVPENLYTPEVLNTLNCSGLPYHRISLRVGTSIMLLRNIDQSAGLCNGTRLTVTELGTHVIGAKILTGSHFGEKVFIPRMNLSPSESKWPFKMQRRQYPIIVSYAMTINKSQGQSLSYVGLYLKNPVFSHGQLYVAISRVTSKSGLKILIHDDEKQPSNQTNNIVYKEVFQNLV